MASIVSGGKEVSKVAFCSEHLWCPYCNGTRWDFVEKVRTCVTRYRCKDCRNTVLYDYSANPSHPYEIFGKGKFRLILEGLRAKRSPKEIMSTLKLTGVS